MRAPDVVPEDAHLSAAEHRMRLMERAAFALVVGLVALLLARLFSPGAGLVDIVVLLVTVAVGIAFTFSQRAVSAVLGERATHEETLTRLLQGLSRTLSSDAAITAIVDELRRGAGADHVVVVLLKPAEAIVEATLVSASSSVPMSVTRFPATELDPISESGTMGVGIGRAGPRHVGRDAAARERNGPRRMQATPMPERRAAINGGGRAQGRSEAASEFSYPAVELVAVPILAEHEPGTEPWARLGTIRDATRISVAGDREAATAGAGTGLIAGVPGGDALSVSGTAADARIETAEARVGTAADAGRGAGNGGSGTIAAGAATAPVVSASIRQPGEDPVVDRLADRVCRAYGLRHVLAAPIRAGGRVVGALVLSRRVETPWSGPTRRLLESAALEVSAALARAHAFEAAEARATTDALTGLPNRAYFEELIGLLGHGRRAGDALGMLMIDIDHFKKLNDRYGHAVGDAVLRGVGWTLRATVRAGDVPARYGGEEFVVVLRHAGHDRAVEIAERIRLAIRDLDPGAFGIADPVTVSVGVAVGTAIPPRALVERADAALYDAKRRGRDRVAVA